MSRTDQPGGWKAGDFSPSRAPVVPRVRRPGEQAAVPIEQRVRAILTETPRCRINLVGPPGSGKSTAIFHLRATIGMAEELRVIDEQRQSGVREPFLLTSRVPEAPGRYATIEMVPWTDDDLAEYLLATHAGRCRAVMERLRSDPDRGELGGLPALWRIVLDEMAADDAVGSVDAALLRFLDRELSDPAIRAAAEYQAFAAVAPSGLVGREPPADVTGEPLRRVMRYGPITSIVAARGLAEGLRDGSTRSFLCERLPLEVIRRVSKIARSLPDAIRALDLITQETVPGAHAMAASILNATGTDWRPSGQRPPDLSDAWLSGAHWDGIHLPGCNLRRAELTDASLANADLAAAVLDEATLRAATLRNASLRAANLRRANLSGANLAAVVADSADFRNADLSDTNFCGASLRGALLRHANLSGARFCRADLSASQLFDACIDGADFSQANLSTACLPRLPLARCTFGSTRLSEAQLTGCNLEGLCADDMDFDGARLDHALLTGSVFHGARFANASLRSCGLAEIDWEGADLCDADLRGSTFHMGTTRSGLVGSGVPCEGSQTGFYTDEFYDRDFKDPAEIRKANLCWADLRGANVDGVDFYLVDLREAQYSEGQGDWFRRCGASLSEG